MDVLRRPRTPNRGQRPAIDDAALWASHDRAKESVVEAQRGMERTVAKAAQQRSQIDGCVERVAAASGKLEACLSHARRVIEVYDRLNVVALNAALEGARAAEGHGRPLMLLADEVRGSVTRGFDLARDLEKGTSELCDEVSNIGDRLNRVHEGTIDVGKDASSTKAALADADSALRDLEARLRKATGFAPETAKHLAEAAEHARLLTSALSLIDGARIAPDERGKTTTLLAPVLVPLVKLLDAMLDKDALLDADLSGDDE